MATDTEGTPVIDRVVDRLRSEGFSFALTKANVRSVSYRFNGIGPIRLCQVFSVSHQKIKDVGGYALGSKQKVIDTVFFKRWSPAYAYVLGLLLTDGCVTDSGDVSFITTDVELLETIKRETLSEHRTRVGKTSSGKNIYQWSVRSPEICSMLPFGPRKSLTVTMPYVPRKLRWHFFRGVLDGDGCVQYDKRYSGRSMACAIATGSRAFAEVFASTFGGYVNGPYGGSSVMKVMFCKRWCLNNFENVYRDSCGIRLTRKYDRWVGGLTALYERVAHVDG